MRGNDKIYGILCFHKDLITRPEEVEALISDLSRIDVDGLIIWISEFDEVKDKNYVLHFLNFIKRLKEKKY